MANRASKQQLPWVKEREAFGRRKDNSKFYNSRKWRKVAKAFRLKHPVCVECERQGLVGPADVCDHVAGLDNIIEAGRDPYAVSELQSMCHYHHNKKSGRESSRRG